MRGDRYSFLRHSGFTVVELIVVIVMLGIMSAYALMMSVSPAEITLASQAQKVASDIRRAQTLAYTQGQRMLVTINAGKNGSYDVSCVAVSTPCSTNFSGRVEKDVYLSGPNLYFNSLGQPSDSSGTPLGSGTSEPAWTLCYPSEASCTSKKTIQAALGTGAVTVLP